MMNLTRPIAERTCGYGCAHGRGQHEPHALRHIPPHIVAAGASWNNVVGHVPHRIVLPIQRHLEFRAPAIGAGLGQKTCNKFDGQTELAPCPLIRLTHVGHHSGYPITPPSRTPRGQGAESKCEVTTIPLLELLGTVRRKAHLTHRHQFRFRLGSVDAVLSRGLIDLAARTHFRGLHPPANTRRTETVNLVE